MNERQKALLEKEFKVNDRFSISRGDYENMPAPMFARAWSDEQMIVLSNNIAAELARYRYKSEKEDALKEEMQDAFWKEMEDCAVKMGMEYYEDFDDDYVEQIEYEWNQIV